MRISFCFIVGSGYLLVLIIWVNIHYIFRMDTADDSCDLFVRNCLKLIHEYSWLLDAFILDFFTEDHWERLPPAWREVLKQVKLEELGHWLLDSKMTLTRVWPLSLIALRAAARTYSLPRQVQDSCQSFVREAQQEETSVSSIACANIFEPGIATHCLQNKNLKNLFLKHVKPKKRHETSVMASLCANAARKSRCSYVIDVGSGKGHLSRLMAYGYGLKVCGIEAQSELVLAARKLDLELEMNASKYLDLSYLQNLSRPFHLETFLDSRVTTLRGLLNTLQTLFGVSAKEDFSFGIVGLHPCGDLAATLLRFFANFKEAKFICIASCCYMKLNLGENDDTSKGYPLSSYFQSLPPELVCQSYEALEVSCHALESYCLRLQQNHYSTLKIHCYRAALEKLIVKHWPDKCHLGLRSVKHHDELSFTEYAKIALSHKNLEMPLADLTSEETLHLLHRWQEVVVVYSLRLMLAPLVETAILLDRLYFLKEQATVSCIVPGFDPLVSPRNLILNGWKAQDTL